VSNLKIKIPEKDVLTRLGYKEGVTEESNLSLVDEQIQESYSLIEPKASYKDFDISVNDNVIELKNGFTIHSSTLAKRLENSKKVTLFAITIGDEISKKTNELVIDTIRDAIGSEAVEELANNVNDIINQRIKLAGFKPIARYSVGYGNWNIEDQSKIIQSLNANFITVAPNHRMAPIKSITAIIGWE
jgi:hypothetical protein